MYNKIFKRILDVLIVLLSFVLLLPLLVIISFMIKLFDKGPLFFSQRRIGKNGNEFTFFKFRSMPVNTGDIPSDKIDNIKLSWIGKFIRRTSIDELPQLLNILIGDMSIVGPRPSISLQKELIEKRHENGSIKCRPGLTGLAQTNSFDGMSVNQKALFDGLYAQKITFFKDIVIILKTVVYLFKPPPKY